VRRGNCNLMTSTPAPFLPRSQGPARPFARSETGRQLGRVGKILNPAGPKKKPPSGFSPFRNLLPRPTERPPAGGPPDRWVSPESAPLN